MTATAEAPAARADTQAAAVLAAARDRRRTADAAEAELLQLAVEWAILHPAESLDAAVIYIPGADDVLEIAGPGAPLVTEFSVPEFAAAVGLSTDAGTRYLGEAVELRYRLPRTYARVVAGDLQAWRARSVARQTISLTQEAAGFVDAQVAPVAHKIGPVSLLRLVTEAIGRFMPEEVERQTAAALESRHVTFGDQDPTQCHGLLDLTATLDLPDALDLQAAVVAGAAQRKALGSTDSLDVRRSQALGDLARQQPVLDFDTDTTDTDRDEEPVSVPRVPARQIVLYVHLSEEALAGRDPVARVENGHRLITVDQIRTWCSRPDTAQVVIKPVLDLAAATTSTPTPSRPGTPRPSPSATAPASSRGAPDQPDHPATTVEAATAATPTTSTPEPAADPPAPATSPHSADATTDSRPTAAGPTPHPTPAPTTGPATTATTTAATPPAPPATPHPPAPVD